MAFFDAFLSWPLWGRAALVLVLALLSLLLLRAPLLKLFSLIPFLLKRLFWVIYLMLEWAVSVIHKILGGVFYRVDNGWAALGEQVDAWFGRWYEAWSKPKSLKPYRSLVIAVLMVCYLSVIVPPMLHIEEGRWQAKGWSIYLWAEDTFFGWLEDHGWYTSNTNWSIGGLKSHQGVIQIPLTVYRVSTVLAIRDIPSTSECVILENLPNGAVVYWDGELAFGLAEGRMEAWVKVTTDSGVEGWGRLNYLHPEEDMELTLVLANISETADPVFHDE